MKLKYKQKMELATYSYEQDTIHAKEHNNSIEPFWVYFIRYFIFRKQFVYINYKICEWRGHRFVDDDPCDPEVGPNPFIYCTRCGFEPH